MTLPIIWTIIYKEFGTGRNIYSGMNKYATCCFIYNKFTIDNKAFPICSIICVRCNIHPALFAPNDSTSNIRAVVQHRHITARKLTSINKVIRANFKCVTARLF